MIVISRIEISETTRNALACIITPSQKARLASRSEVTQFLEGCVAGLSQSHSVPGPVQPLAPRNMGRLSDLAARERTIHPEFADRTDSFVIGYCKVKYAQELR